jgi:hypothetical protein
MAERILTTRELNRATLARQLLLERSPLGVFDAIKQLAGMQAQVANAPYTGLWTRLQTFQRDDLTQLYMRRQVVRGSSLRCTLHLMPAEDYLLFHPLIQPALSRNLHIFASKTPGFDMASFEAEIRAYVKEQPRTGVELRAKMEELYPGMGRPQIADSVRIHLALIQPPPAGLWGFTGRPTHTEATEWLGRPLAGPQAGLREFVLRYLAAFGPASVNDLQAWSGATKLQGAVEALRPELLTFRDEQGKELFDLPDAPRPAADVPAPVHFLPEFDNVLLAHADRKRIIADAYRPLVFGGEVPARDNVMRTFLVDGFVAGHWKIKRTPEQAHLQIEPFAPLADEAEQALREEGTRLLQFVADGNCARTIAFMPYNGNPNRQNL